MKLLFSLIALVPTLAIAGDIVIYPNAITTNNLAHNASCPGDNRWHATYAKSITDGWGWSVDTNGGNTLFLMTDTNSPNHHIQYLGFFGDPGCTNGPSILVPNPPASAKYRITIYGTNNPPSTTNSLPLVLHGFLP